MEEEEADLVQELLLDLQLDMDEALISIEDILCGSDFADLKQFHEYCKRNMQKSTCTCSWNTNYLSGSCKDCQLSASSCVCIRCYLEGHHDQHNAHVKHLDSGCCDCGDHCLWNPKRNCPRHPGSEENPETQIEPGTRENLINIFTAIFLHIYSVPHDDFEFLISYIIDFVNCGDAIRRCVSIALCNRTDPNDLLDKLGELRKEETLALTSLFGDLSNDYVFRTEMAKIMFKRIIALENELNNIADRNLFPRNTLGFVGHFEILRFFYHFIDQITIDIMLQDQNFSWVVFLSDWTNLLIKLVANHIDYNKHQQTESLERYFCVHRIIPLIFSKQDQIENIIFFCNDLIETLNGTEGIFIDHHVDQAPQRMDDSHIASYIKIQQNILTLTNYMLKYIDDFDNIHVQLFGFLQKKIISPSFDRIAATGSIYERSVLESSTNISFNHPLHLFVWNWLLKKKENLVPFFNEITKDIGKDKICFSMALLPLRLHATLMLGSFDFFAHNDKSLENASLNYFWLWSHNQLIFHQFSLIQGMFGLCEDKTSYLNMIVHVFDAFNERENDNLPAKEFCLIHFLLTLFYDRSCIKLSKTYIFVAKIISRLRAGELTGQQLYRYTRFSTISNPKYSKIIEKYTTKVTYSDYTTYKLADDTVFSFANAWDDPKGQYYLIESYLKYSKGSLLNMAELEELPFGLTYESAIESPILFALLFRYFANMFYKPTDSSENSMHYFLHFFVLISQHCRKVEIPKETPEPILAANFEELFQKIPTDFLVFVNTPISYCHYPATTIIKLILTTAGSIGETVLLNSNVGYRRKQKSEKEIKRMKKMVSNIKKDIIEEYKRKCEAIKPQLESLNANDKCSVCKQSQIDTPLVYPILIFPSCLAKFAHNKLNGKKENHSAVATFRICKHLVHKTCIAKNKFNCPSCSEIRNSYLPKLNGYQTLDSSEFQNIVDFFGDILDSLNANEIDNVLIIDSFVEYIQLLEIRQRSKPDCLDDEGLKELLYNYFLCLYHRRNTLNKIDYNTSSFYSLIINLINEPSPQKEFSSLAKYYAGRTSTAELVQYLRCVAIFQHFSLDIPLSLSDLFIDWENILSPQSLFHRFDLKVPNVIEPLPLFTPIKLPKTFLELSQPPYNYDIVNYDGRNLAVDLLTGDIVSIHATAMENEFMNLVRHLNKVWAHGVSIYLGLNGTRASSINYVSGKIDIILQGNHIYVDKNGDPDVGIDRMLPNLFLQESVYADDFDQLLSGKWIERISRSY